MIMIADLAAEPLAAPTHVVKRTAAERRGHAHPVCIPRKTAAAPECVVSRTARWLRKAKAHSYDPLVRELHAFAKQAGLLPIEGSTVSRLGEMERCLRNGHMALAAQI